MRCDDRIWDLSTHCMIPIRPKWLSRCPERIFNFCFQIYFLNTCTLVAPSDSHWERGNVPCILLLFISTFCREHHALEFTGSESCSKYVGVQTVKTQVCLNRPVYTYSPEGDVVGMFLIENMSCTFKNHGTHYFSLQPVVTTY